MSLPSIAYSYCIVVNVMENDNTLKRLAGGEHSVFNFRNELAKIKALLKQQGG